MAIKINNTDVISNARALLNITSYNGYTPASNAITLTAGAGLSGGGNLTANRTFSVNFASQAEAEAGADNAKSMTPLRTKQLLDANTGTTAGKLVKVEPDGKLPASTFGLEKAWTYSLANVGATTPTLVDFTGIPNDVVDLELLLDNVSTLGNSHMLIQLIDSVGAVRESGYSASSLSLRASLANIGVAATNGFPVYREDSNQAFSGSIAFKRRNINSNEWLSHHVLATGPATGRMSIGGGRAVLDGVTGIRVRSFNAAETFDVGIIGFRYR